MYQSDKIIENYIHQVLKVRDGLIESRRPFMLSSALTLDFVDVLHFAPKNRKKGFKKKVNSKDNMRVTQFCALAFYSLSLTYTLLHGGDLYS